MNTKNIVLFILCAVTPFISFTMENSKQLKQGILIAIEGIDGSGKTTLAQSVNTTLTQRGFDTMLTREPGDSALGKQIRELVKTQTMPISPKAEFLLFAADRAQHFSELIIPALEQNKLIISDRLADSSLAYQGYGRGLDLETLQTVNSWAMQKKSPDITIYVCVPVNIALERCKKRELSDRFEHKSLLEKVDKGFEEIYKNNRNVIYVSGTDSPEELNEIVSNAIENWIKEKKYLS